jgi:hypothetical protein
VEFQTGDVEGIEIVLTQTASEVSGTVTTGPGAPAVDGTVVIFADDRERWGFQTRYVRTARPDQNGRYTFLGLPPARYLAVAVDYLEPGEETNPDYLEALRRLSTPLTLGEGESKTADLRIAESP